MTDLDLLRAMALIRRFEAALVNRRDHGFQLLSSGQEAVAVGVCAALTPGDQLLSSGRSIAPALARGVSPGRVMAELLGKKTGPCSGRGGRGHLADPAAGFFGAHAVVGGNITIAAGVALERSYRRGEGIVICMFGDGACGQGALHEALNIAALWRLPLLFVCDNNQYSVSTPISQGFAPSPLSSIAAPFSMPRATIDGMDVKAVEASAAGFADQIRAGAGPCFLECVSHRFYSHSTSTKDTRSKDELAAIKPLCPIERLAGTMMAEGRLSVGERSALEREVDLAVAAALEFADGSPYPDASEVLRDVV